MKPFGTVSSQIIGHWIKALLEKVSIDNQSIYGLALSAAHKIEIDIAIIGCRARWTQGYQEFFHFYNIPTQAPNDQFARAILR